MICVDTPTDPQTGPDLTRLMAAVASVADHAERAEILVLRSTVPPGTSVQAEEEFGRLNGSRGISVVSHPEFFQEGRAVEDCRHPLRIVVGSRDKAAAGRVADLWNNPDVPTVFSDLESAEMTKQASNAFLAMKISFINDIARICDAVGADIDTVAEGMGLDPRIGPRYLKAGVGFGGSCLPKDLRALVALARSHGWEPRTLTAAIAVNDIQRQLVSDLLAERLGSLSGKTIALLGLAFKPDTSDLRDSPAVAIAGLLVDGGATVVATDPVVQGGEPEIPAGVRLADDAYSAAAGAMAVVLATEWREFTGLDWRRMAGAMEGRLVVDGRNMLDPGVIRDAGLEYVGIGRGAVAG
jgi:UDPglucose 6-dehydrogenase